MIPEPKPKVFRTPIHEAGHCIAAVALGVCFDYVYWGPTWKSACWTQRDALFDLSKRPVSDGCLIRAHAEQPKDAIIACSGYVSEFLWEHGGEIPLDTTVFKDEYRYTGDKKNVDPALWDEAFIESESILRANWKYVRALAHLLNKNKHRAIHEAEVLALCDIWQTTRENSPILDRWTRKFKFWYAKDATPEEEQRYAAVS